MFSHRYIILQFLFFTMCSITPYYETTCVTVVILEKFKAGQFGWYCDGCGECTISVTLKDEKLKCFVNHETDELVPRCLFELNDY